MITKVNNEIKQTSEESIEINEIKSHSRKSFEDKKPLNHSTGQVENKALNNLEKSNEHIECDHGIIGIMSFGNMYHCLILITKVDNEIEQTFEESTEITEIESHSRFKKQPV